MGIAQTNLTRVLGNIDYSLERQCKGGYTRADYPYFTPTSQNINWNGKGSRDHSFPVNYWASEDSWLRYNSEEDPENLWIAHVNEKGKGMAHIQTRDMDGRKVFSFGSDPRGMWWKVRCNFLLSSFTLFRIIYQNLECQIILR